MPILRDTTGAQVEVEVLSQAEALQNGIGQSLLRLLPVVKGEDPIDASEAADACNAQLRIAKENEAAMVMLRTKDYINRTKHGVEDFLFELGLTSPEE